MGNSILAAALTMTLLILPIIIVSSQEAIRAVPNSVREAFGLGANKWQTIRRVVLPAALPGILTDSFCLFQERWEKQHHLCLSVYRLYYWQHLEVYWINFQHYLSKYLLGRKCHKKNSRMLHRQALSFY